MNDTSRETALLKKQKAEALSYILLCASVTIFGIIYSLACLYFGV